MSNETASRIPTHAAIIVDGNRRWARQRMLPASFGHKAGFDRLKEITRYAVGDRGVHVLSLYVFSTENFSRDAKEVGYLMDLFANNFRTIADEMNERGCQVLFSGRREGLQQRVLNAMDYMMDLTKDNKKGIVNFCLNYGSHAELTDAVRRTPYSVILFDEIEKAHPDIFNILLQIMDEGRLTDSKRHVVDFKNVVVILTSNIGFANPDPSSNMGFRANRDDGSPQVRFERMKKKVLEETKQVFKPEFLNRLDASVVFHSLETEDLLKIVDIMLDKVRKELSTSKRYLEVTPDAKRALVASCHEPQYGARPLRRAIQRMLEDPLADLVIDGQFPEGSHILVDLREEDKAELAAREAEGMLGKSSANPKADSDSEEEEFMLVFTLID